VKLLENRRQFVVATGQNAAIKWQRRHGATAF
jgi:hypothetical protein